MFSVCVAAEELKYLLPAHTTANQNTASYFEY